MNDRLGQCAWMTPILAKYELTAMRHKIRRRNEEYLASIYALSIADNHLAQTFFKHCFENLDNYPIFDFTDNRDSQQVKVQSPVLNILLSDGFKEVINEAAEFDISDRTS